MISEKVFQKLKILAESAKYDVSCASSGVGRSNVPGTVGNAAAWGICHSFAEDGRCVSLLKIMMSNHCIYDCAYCVNRRTNDQKRVAFTPAELCELVIGFYRRNYIEGLFLSSGVIRNKDYTMEQMISTVKELRVTHRFNGYIHMKVIPGASQELIHEAGLWVDRLSVNMEIPSEDNLKLLAPEKNYASILSPIKQITEKIVQSKEERRKTKHAPQFSPAGQSTQLIIGATPDSDHTILNLASKLYQKRNLKRVYYSGFIPVNSYDTRLPALKTPPLQREHRLYEADWLLRFYGFTVEELLTTDQPDLDLTVDPKLAFALRNPWLFPVDINKADYALLLRVPGIGQKSAQLIVTARRHSNLNSAHLKKMGVVLKRAKYFITCHEIGPAQTIQELKPDRVKELILLGPKILKPIQLSLFREHELQPLLTP